MRDENDFGSETFLTFAETNTEKGKERLDALYEKFVDADDEELCKRFFGYIVKREDYETQEEYEQELLLYGGIQKLMHEKCVVEKIADNKFTFKMYTYYDTLTGIWGKIARENKYIKVNGNVIRTFESQDGDVQERDETFVISDGMLYYEYPYNDEEYYIEVD